MEQLVALRRGEGERGLDQAAVEHEGAQGDVPEEAAGGGEVESFGGDRVGLDLADVVQEGAGDGEFGVGLAHRLGDGEGHAGDLPDVEEQAAHLRVVSAGGPRGAGKAEAEVVVGEEEVHRGAQARGGELRAEAVDLVPELVGVDVDGGEEGFGVELVAGEEARGGGEAELPLASPLVPLVAVHLAHGGDEGAAGHPLDPGELFLPEGGGVDGAGGVGQGEQGKALAGAGGLVGARLDEEVTLQAVTDGDGAEVGGGAVGLHADKLAGGADNGEGRGVAENRVL